MIGGGDMREKAFTEMRRQMVDNQLKRRNISSDKVLDAFLKVPRELFVPKGYEGWAYEDGPVSIGIGQTISQPYIVALMTEALAITPEDVILEVGTGSGYQTAILALLCKHVYTIERIPLLQTRAQEVLEGLGIDNVTYRIGDGSVGWKEHACFDKIIVTAAASEIPKELVSQLKEGGLMVIPCGGTLFQELLLIQKQEGRLSKTNLCACRFVQLIKAEYKQD